MGDSEIVVGLGLPGVRPAGKGKGVFRIKTYRLSVADDGPVDVALGVILERATVMQLCKVMP